MPFLTEIENKIIFKSIWNCKGSWIVQATLTKMSNGDSNSILVFRYTTRAN